MAKARKKVAARRGNSKPAQSVRSFRLRDETLDELDRLAKSKGTSSNALAQRMLDEALRTQLHPFIWFLPTGSGERVPAIRGTRLYVGTVVETIRQNDNSVERTAKYLDQDEQLIRAAVSYYGDYTDEVEEWIADRREFAERAHAAWLREQELLS